MSDDLGPLSERELEVLKLVATGASNQQVARALTISPNTVKVHLRNIFDKLGVQSRTEATMEAVRRGWVSVVSAEIPSEALPEAPPLPEPEATLPEAPTRPPLKAWQHAYMFVVLALALAAITTPLWWRVRSRAAPPTPLSDVGQLQTSLAPRPDVARWTANAPLPVPRSRLALVADAKKLYAIAGETAEGVTDSVAIYDPPSNRWLPGPRKPTAVANIAAVFLGDHLYVPGGVTATGGVTNILEVFDPQAATWEARSPLPAPVAAYGLAQLNGKLYLFGGWDGAGYSAATFVYDPATDRWTSGTAIPSPRAFAAAAALGSVIYLVGGFDGRQELAEVLAYDPAAEGTAAGPWSLRAPLGQGRAGLGLAAIGPRLYAVGGGWRLPLAFNEQYDPQIDAWSRIGTPVAGQWRNLGLAAFDQKLYAVGGWSGAYLAVTEQYQALIRQLLPLGSKGG